MKNEKMLELVSSMLEGNYNIEELRKIQTQLINDIAKDEAKKLNKTKPYSAAIRILKNAKKSTGNTALHYACNTENGQYVCDSYKAVKFYEPLPLPISEDSEKYPNVESIINANKNYKAVNIELPDIKYLKTWVKTFKYKNSKKVISIFMLENKTENIKYFVNAQYLLDVMECLPGCCCFVRTKKNDTLPALHFNAEIGEGVLMPLNPFEEHDNWENAVKSHIEKITL